MENISQQILHLRKDKRLKKLIEEVGIIKVSKNQDLYFSLIRSVVGQQLSVKAAATIWQRFLGIFKNEYPEAKLLLSMEDDNLRALGLSYQKAGYIKNIARFSIEKTLDYKILKTKSDEELIAYLIGIKGVGRWTVEMILMFNLNRPDVFPKDDVGIQTGMIKLYNLKIKDKKDLYSKMEKLSEAWRPHRTLACLYIWRHKDTLPVK